MRFDSDSLLEQVKLLGTPPQGRFEDDEIFSIASNQINSKLVPFILSLKEEYYLTSEDQTITQDQQAYPIPARAIGLTLREVKVIDGTAIKDINRIDPTEITSLASGQVTSFYLQGHDVMLYPTPQSTQGTLRLYYFLSPSEIVATALCARITDIDRVTGLISAVTPSDWTTGETYDLVSSKNGHQTKAFDLVASAVVASTSITFTATDIPASIVVGDYVALAGQAPYIQAPDICFQYVVQLTIEQLMIQMSDQAGLESAKAEVARLQELIVAQLQNRVQGAPKQLRITL